MSHTAGEAYHIVHNAACTPIQASTTNCKAATGIPLLRDGEALALLSRAAGAIPGGPCGHGWALDSLSWGAAHGRGWILTTFRVPSNPTILWFYESNTTTGQPVLLPNHVARYLKLLPSWNSLQCVSSKSCILALGFHKPRINSNISEPVLCIMAHCEQQGVRSLPPLQALTRTLCSSFSLKLSSQYQTVTQNEIKTLMKRMEDWERRGGAEPESALSTVWRMLQQHTAVGTHQLSTCRQTGLAQGSVVLRESFKRNKSLQYILLNPDLSVQWDKNKKNMQALGALLQAKMQS